MQYIKGYEGAMQNKSSAFKTHEQIGAKHAPLNLNHKTPNPTLKKKKKKKKKNKVIGEGEKFKKN
jgi:hypothetical protein